MRTEALQPAQLDDPTLKVTGRFTGDCPAQLGVGGQEPDGASSPWLLTTRWCPPSQVVDVGGGTGFCTQGIVAAGISPTNITLLVREWANGRSCLAWCVTRTSQAMAPR